MREPVRGVYFGGREEGSEGVWDGLSLGVRSSRDCKSTKECVGGVS